MTTLTAPALSHHTGSVGAVALPHGTQSGYSYWGCRCAVCTQAKRDRDQIYYEKNREKVKAKVRAYTVQNPEKVQEHNRLYRDKNGAKLREKKRQEYAADPEKVKARNQAWRKANPEKRRAQSRAERQRNPERARARALASYYRQMQRDPERVRANRRAYSKTPQAMLANRLKAHRRRGIQYDPEAREWVEIILGDPCSYCGAPAVEIEHIEPVVAGGSGEWDNLAGACRSCNASKHDQELLPFLLRKVA